VGVLLVASTDLRRRLSAILAADAADYSRLMGADEVATVRDLDAARAVFRAEIEAHQGRVVDTAGDSILAVFETAAGAVDAALAIQKTLALASAASPADHKLRFRVGVHLGDIIEKPDGTVYGDGVNIAARLQALAEPGGITVSGSVRAAVQGKVRAGFEDRGEQSVKNIPEPVHAYRVLADGVPVGGRRSIAKTSHRWPVGRRVATTLVAACVLLAAGALVLLWPWQHVEVAGLDTHRVAILPFNNISPDPEDAYFADGITEELISRISRIGELSVIARTSVMQYKDTAKRIDAIGRELAVGTILEGSVRKAGDRLRITAQLIDVGSQAHLWSQDYDRDLGDVFAIQSEIANKVADALKVTLVSGGAGSTGRPQAGNLEVYSLYLKGRYFFNQGTKEGLEKAQQYFEKALAADPGYAPAYAGLALVFGDLTWKAFLPPAETYPKAKAMAERAIALDGRLPDAWVALALAEIDYFWNWDAGERAVKQALEIDPNHAMAHDIYGHRILSAVRGRYDEAIGEMRRALALDPLSLGTNNHLGMVYRHARRYDLAIEQFHRTIETWPNYMFPHLGLGWAYSSKGMYDEAIEQLQLAAELTKRTPYVLGHLADAYARAGRRTEALALVEELKERATRSPVTASAFFAAYRGLGDKDQAFQWLEQMYEERHPEIIYLKDGENDVLRSDPRFTEMLRKLGL
jgi:adenylate cyclase